MILLTGLYHFSKFLLLKREVEIEPTCQKTDRQNTPPLKCPWDTSSKANTDFPFEYPLHQVFLFS